MPKEKPGMVRPTVTGEILRRNGGKLPKNLAPKRVNEDEDDDCDAASTITDASTTTRASTSTGASVNTARTSSSAERRPFAVDFEPEDKFYTKVDIYGATRIPKNDVLYVANYMEYIATEAVLEQPVSNVNTEVNKYLKYCRSGERNCSKIMVQRDA